MCMGGGGQNPISTQLTTIPDWLKDATQKNISMADTIAGTTYTNYENADPTKRFAARNELQTRGFDFFKNMLDSQGNLTTPGQARVDTALGGLQDNATAGIREITAPNQINAQTFGTAQANQYMNPYMNTVIQQGLQNLNQQNADQAADLRRRQAARGAFGNNRTALQDSQLQQAQNQRVDQFLANQLNQGYQNAQAQFNQDAARDLSAQQQNIANLQNQQRFNQAADLQARGLGNQAYGQIGQMQSGLNADAMKFLLGGQAAGTAQQQFDQLGMDYRYNDFLQQRDYPLRNLAIRQGALTGAAYPTTQTTFGPGNNNLASNLGTFASLLGGAGLFGQSQGG